MNAMNLTQRPPRSPRVRLGGYSILPRVLDKARATLAGVAGDYRFNNPLDRVLFQFVGVSAEEFLAEVRRGGGDFELLQWVQMRSGKAPHDIESWSRWTDTLVESDAESREWLAGRLRALDERRTDIHTLFDYLDFDDYRSFGGPA